MTDKDFEVGLRFTVEESDSKRALAVLDEIRRSEARIEAQSEKVTKALKAQGATDKEIRKVTAALREQEKQTQRLAEREAERERNRARTPKDAKGLASDGGRVGSLISATGGLLNDVGIGGQAVTALGQAFDVGEYLNATGSGLATVAGAAIPTIAALGAVALAMDHYNKTLETSKAVLNQAITGVKVYYEAIATGTTDSINKQIQEMKAQKDIVDAQNREITLAYINGMRSGNPAIVALGRVFNSFADIENEIKNLNTESGKLAGQMDGLNRALTSSQVAANDAAAALERKANTELAGVNTVYAIEKRVRDLQRETQRTNSTSAVNARLQAISDERGLLKQQQEALEKIVNPSKEVTAAIGLLGENIRNLDYEMLRLLNEDWSKLLNPFQRLASSLAPLGKIAEGIADRWDKASESTRKRNEDILKIEEDTALRRADIEKKYADQLIDIAKSAVKAANDALRNLQEKRSELSRDYARSEMDAVKKFNLDQMDVQIEAQRDEAKAIQDHYVTLCRIREDAQDREYELALHRDFAGLFFSRRDTNKQLNRANEDFGMQQSERRAQLAQNIADIRQNYEREREQRWQQYQQSLADAQVQYQRQRADLEQQRIENIIRAREAHNRETRELADNLRRQLDLRRQVWQSELTAIFTIKAAANGLATTIGTIGRLAIGAITGSLFRRATGGPLSIGDMSLVNDGFIGQRESYNGVAFPPGQGLFIPTRPGYVSANSGKGGAQVSMSITVQEARTPQLTAQAVGVIVEQKLTKVFG